MQKSPSVVKDRSLITLAATHLQSLAWRLLATAVSTPSGAAPTSTAAATTQPAAPSWFVFLQQFGPIILIVVVFWVFMSGSKRKQDRARSSLLDNLKKGDKVKLIGGEYGAVVETRDGRVLVKVDEGSNTKIWYAREAIASVEKDVKEETSK